jgi:hypothetical protein
VSCPTLHFILSPLETTGKNNLAGAGIFAEAKKIRGKQKIDLFLEF